LLEWIEASSQRGLKGKKGNAKKLDKTNKLMNIIDLLIQLISGAAGGNLVGALFKNMSLGPVGNSLAGIVGGGLGGQILQSLMGSGAAGGGLDLQGVIGSIAGGGIGGGVIMAIIGFIKSMMAKSP